MKKPTIDRILQSQGFGSRRGCRQLIVGGAVEIDGRPVTDFEENLETAGLSFTVHGERWVYHEFLYIALNKPSNFECSRKPSHHSGVLSLLPEQFRQRNLQPVGRLDHDTAGPLLLSDDGEFIHAQSSPRRHVPKVYVATTHDPVTPALISQLNEGVKLIDEPAPISGKARQLDSHSLEIVLEQGRYHQVKRMLAAAGNHCVALCRTAIGALACDQLALREGQWCHLDPEQRALLTAGPK
ncbi:MAG: 16S rRNA pseudouridine(516) synthase [Betaproteobacteria bacterium]|nr:16S rRNA pseudouridine(516) synthase [Betaproteobacteria bacterium]